MPSTADPHAQLAASLLELPRVEAAIGRQAQVDAGAGRQVLRRFRPAPFCEVGGRADDRGAQVRPDPNGNHVLRYHLAGADAGVETPHCDVRRGVVDDDLHLDVRVVRQELFQGRTKESPHSMVVCRDADGLAQRRLRHPELGGGARVKLRSRATVRKAKTSLRLVRGIQKASF